MSFNYRSSGRRALETELNERKMSQTDAQQMLAALLTLLTVSPRGIILTVSTPLDINSVSLASDRQGFMFGQETGPAGRLPDALSVGRRIVSQGDIWIIEIGPFGSAVELYRAPDQRSSRGYKRHNNSVNDQSKTRQTLSVR